jgi:hypothetical protein
MPCHDRRNFHLALVTQETTPVCILPALRQLASSAAVFFGHHGAVRQLARHRRPCRQGLYRDADDVPQAVQGTQAQARSAQPRQALAQAQRAIDRLRQDRAAAVALDEGRQAHFASTAQAEGIRLPPARRLLHVLRGERTPSGAPRGTYPQAAAARAGALLGVLGAAVRPQVEQVAADEIDCGRTPILMTVEPESLCWLGGRRVGRLGGAAWRHELRPLARLPYGVTDAGNHRAHGVHLLQAERRAAGARPGRLPHLPRRPARAAAARAAGGGPAGPGRRTAAALRAAAA